MYCVGFEQEGDLNMERTNTWIATLLQEKGVDIYPDEGRAGDGGMRRALSCTRACTCSSPARR